jgi:hypothetical protein
MLTYKEKLSLLSEMIQLAKIDDNIHAREKRFISLIAEEFTVSKEDLDELWLVKAEKKVIKSEFQRIEQFYRLALLMHSDYHKQDEELDFLHTIGLNLGLNPVLINNVLDEMEKSPTHTIEPDLLLSIFKSQHN